MTGRPLKPPLYVLPHGVEVVGEYAPNLKCPYWRVRIRPHAFFPDAPVISNGCYVRRSRVVLASKLGRALTREEHAHHDDEDRFNDQPSNIKRLTAAAHNRLHKTGTKHRAESKAAISQTLRRLFRTGIRVPKPARGSQQGSSKLSEQDALAIKHSTERTGALVERYRVSRTTVKQIRNGSIWRHIP